MFYIYYCKGKINNKTYDIKIDKKEKEELIHKFSFEEKGNYKEYWENNVRITSSKDNHSFHYIEDIRYEYVKVSNKDFLIHELKEKPCQFYNFYKVHQEETYQKYQVKKGDIIMELREYQDYLTLTLICDSIVDFYQQTIF